jgi:hypothetical protein
MLLNLVSKFDYIKNDDSFCALITVYESRKLEDVNKFDHNNRFLQNLSFLLNQTNPFDES